jgi:hypothetical protein
MEMCHNNARLPLRIKADAPSFVTKERHVPWSARLPLLK